MVHVSWMDAVCGYVCGDCGAGACVSVAAVLVCAGLEICGTHPRSGLAQGTAQRASDLTGRGCAHGDHGRCGELARHDFPRVVVVGVSRTLAVEFHPFLSTD